MPKINARSKGARGEREFCEWLKDTFKLEELPKRDLSQSRDSGADVNFRPFAFEVKRRESLDLYDWWSQVVFATRNKDCESFGLIPIVAFRQNGAKWEFLISAEFIGLQNGYVRLDEFTFIRWVRKYMERYKRAFCASEIAKKEMDLAIDKGKQNLIQ